MGIVNKLLTYTSSRGRLSEFRIWNRRAFQKRKPYQFPGRRKNSPYYSFGWGANPRPPAHPDFITSKESYTCSFGHIYKHVGEDVEKRGSEEGKEGACGAEYVRDGVIIFDHMCLNHDLLHIYTCTTVKF